MLAANPQPPSPAGVATTAAPGKERELGPQDVTAGSSAPESPSRGQSSSSLSPPSLPSTYSSPLSSAPSDLSDLEDAPAPFNPYNSSSTESPAPISHTMYTSGSTGSMSFGATSQAPPPVPTRQPIILDPYSQPSIHHTGIFPPNSSSSLKPPSPIPGLEPAYFHEEGGVPVFRPTMEQFHDFTLFARHPKVVALGMQAGIIKVIPPMEW